MGILAILSLVCSGLASALLILGIVVSIKYKMYAPIICYTIFLLVNVFNILLTISTQNVINALV